MTTGRNSRSTITLNPADEAADYRSELWRMADALRGSMDAAEYKHVVLGLTFLKYISDAFEEARAKLESERSEGADPEDMDEYRGENIFWAPPEARWAKLRARARQAALERAVDDAMTAIERDNPALKGVLPKDHARPALDKTRLGRVVDLVSDIKVGGAEARATDALGSVYECFLEQFALAEGKNSGEFYTPRSVVRLLVEMLEPYRGQVYDPCCGSSGMFVRSVGFIGARNLGRMTDRTHPELTADDIARGADIYHAWRGGEGLDEYADTPGLCKSATLEEVRKHGHVLTPGRYVGAAPQAEDGEPFEEKMSRLAAQWRPRLDEAARLDAAVEGNLEKLGIGDSL